MPDAQLAALALEHGVPVASADTYFARFTEVKWVNPPPSDAGALLRLLVDGKIAGTWSRK